MYQKALDFADVVNEQINSFPKHKMYKLASQFIRAADSSEKVDEENRAAVTELSKMITSYKAYLKKKMK
jgi:hypothetical protein